MSDPDYLINQQEKREDIWKSIPEYHHEGSADTNWSCPLENT